MKLREFEEAVLALREDAGGNQIAFLMMPFSASSAIEAVHQYVRHALRKYGVVTVRADDKAYSEDLWENIRVYLHAADFGVVIYEQIDTSNYNPDVSIEVGYMMALRTPICLLKEKRLPRLPTDIVGRLYYEFDIFDPKNSISAAIEKWAASVGLSVPTKVGISKEQKEFVILPPGVGPKSLKKIMKPLLGKKAMSESELHQQSGLGGHSFSRHIGYLRTTHLIVQVELPGRPIKLTKRGEDYYSALAGRGQAKSSEDVLSQA
jgi:nucleoside 2-deoxyribosyltransferase